MTQRPDGTYEIQVGVTWMELVFIIHQMREFNIESIEKYQQYLVDMTERLKALEDESDPLAYNATKEMYYSAMEDYNG